MSLPDAQHSNLSRPAIRRDRHPRLSRSNAGNAKTRTPLHLDYLAPHLRTAENSSERAIWFKAHYQNWAKPPSDFNQAEWLARHTKLLIEQRDLWVQRGYETRIEDQNAFRLRGRTATLAGKPDLLVLNKDHVLITDVKTGQERPWHRYQLMIYMYALPRALPEFRGARIAGEIIYPNRTQRVPQGGVDQGFIENLSSLIRRIAAPDPPNRVPSVAECRFCEITATDCPERVDADHDDEAATTDDF